jgi:hypothetical protein
MWVRFDHAYYCYWSRFLFSRVPGHVALLCLVGSGCTLLDDKVPEPPAVLTAELPPAVPADPVATIDTSPDVKPPSPAPKKHAAVPRPKPRKAAPDLREALAEPALARDKQSGIQPEQLIGLSPPAVEKLIGSPAEVRDDQLSREWVYTGPGCNFRIFFYPDLNAASFHALKYGGSDNNGEMLAASNACVRGILTARANAAH